VKARPKRAASAAVQRATTNAAMPGATDVIAAAAMAAVAIATIAIVRICVTVALLIAGRARKAQRDQAPSALTARAVTSRGAMSGHARRKTLTLALAAAMLRPPAPLVTIMRPAPITIVAPDVRVAVVVAVAAVVVIARLAHRLEIATLRPQAAMTPRQR
jgi:hypothetical protein